MLKQLLDDNRIFSALVCVLVFIASGLLYLQTLKHQAKRDVQRTQENVQQMQTPQPQTQPAETGGGHYHPDGTYHVGPHDAHTPPATTTPATPQTGTTTTPDPKTVTWTGKPLREMSSPDTLSPEERKARDAKIQKLNTEIEALRRLSASRINQASKLNDEHLLILTPKRDAIEAEIDALRADTSLSAAEKQRLRAALDKQYDELTAVMTAKMDKSRALNNEGRMLSEKRIALRIERDALAGR